jgi:ACT domain-containing protein
MQSEHATALAVDIATAAKMVGISRAQFYRLYLKPGRVTAIKTGKRDRIIDVAELTEAYRTYVAEQRTTTAEA